MSSELSFGFLNASSTGNHLKTELIFQTEFKKIIIGNFLLINLNWFLNVRVLATQIERFDDARDVNLFIECFRSYFWFLGFFWVARKKFKDFSNGAWNLPGTVACNIFIAFCLIFFLFINFLFVLVTVLNIWRHAIFFFFFLFAWCDKLSWFKKFHD